VKEDELFTYQGITLLKRDAGFYFSMAKPGDILFSDWLHLARCMVKVGILKNGELSEAKEEIFPLELRNLRLFTCEPGGRTTTEHDEAWGEAQASFNPQEEDVRVALPWSVGGKTLKESEGGISLDAGPWSATDLIHLAAAVLSDERTSDVEMAHYLPFLRDFAGKEGGEAPSVIAANSPKRGESWQDRARRKLRERLAVEGLLE